MCFGINSGENLGFSLRLIEVFTGWEATMVLESILCRLSNLTLNVLPQAISQPSPMSGIVLGNEQSRGRMDKHVRLTGLYFSYQSALQWNCSGGGHFSSNGERSTRVEGGRLAGREGGERIYYTFINVCNDAERMSPSAVDQDHNNGWIKQYCTYQRDTPWMTFDMQPYHNATSHTKSLFWCLVHLKWFSEPDTW